MEERYNSPVRFSVGDIFASKSCGDMLVIGNNTSRDVTVEFLNTGTIVKDLQRGNVLRGGVNDHFHPCVEGKGVCW